VLCLALLAGSLTLLVVGEAGWLYLAGALLLGSGFLARAVGFARQRSPTAARDVLRASSAYLSALLILQLLDSMHR
jgi:heme o synthase